MNSQVLYLTKSLKSNILLNKSIYKDPYYDIDKVYYI